MQNSRGPIGLFSSVDTTAFASILIILIIVVLVVASISYNPHRAASVDVPKVSHPVAMQGALRDDAMKVSILRDGQVYFGADRIWSGDLAQKIQDRLKDREVERKIYVVADARAKWGAVKSALDGVGRAGIIRIAFLVH